MPCTILRPDPQVLFDQMRDMFSSTVLGGGRVIPESNEWYVIANDYAMAEQFYAVADQMWRETNPETACCENLYAIAARAGVYPNPATHSEGYAKLTGLPGSVIPNPVEIGTTNGTYVSVGTLPETMPETGELIIRVRALVPGAVGNADGKITTGSLETPSEGLDGVVTICGGRFCGGKEAETCEQFRTRYLQRLAYQPKATQGWIKNKMLEFPCVTRVCVREGSCCICEACGETSQGALAHHPEPPPLPPLPPQQLPPDEGLPDDPCSGEPGLFYGGLTGGLQHYMLQGTNPEMVRFCCPNDQFHVVPNVTNNVPGTPTLTVYINALSAVKPGGAITACSGNLCFGDGTPFQQGQLIQGQKYVFQYHRPDFYLIQTSAPISPIGGAPHVASQQARSAPTQTASDSGWTTEPLPFDPTRARATTKTTTCLTCCKDCGHGMEFYVFMDDTFPCGIPPDNILFDINKWMFGEHPGYGEGQVEIGVCGQIYRPEPLKIDISIEIIGCPTANQKQIITDQLNDLFRHICPSMPFRPKQIELIVMNVLGAEIQSIVEITYPEYEDHPGKVPPRCMLDITKCGDLEPGCDVMLCVNKITFTVLSTFNQCN